MFPTVVQYGEEPEYGPGFTDEDIANLDTDFINNYYYNNRIFKRSYYERLDGIIHTCCINACNTFTLAEFCPKRNR